MPRRPAERRICDADFRRLGSRPASGWFGELRAPGLDGPSSQEQRVAAPPAGRANSFAGSEHCRRDARQHVEVQGESRPPTLDAHWDRESAVVGRVTPCAPSPATTFPGAHGVTRPTGSLMEGCYVQQQARLGDLNRSGVAVERRILAAVGNPRAGAHASGMFSELSGRAAWRYAASECGHVIHAFYVVQNPRVVSPWQKMLRAKVRALNPGTGPRRGRTPSAAGLGCAATDSQHSRAPGIHGPLPNSRTRAHGNHEQRAAAPLAGRGNSFAVTENCRQDARQHVEVHGELRPPAPDAPRGQEPRICPRNGGPRNESYFPGNPSADSPVHGMENRAPGLSASSDSLLAAAAAMGQGASRVESVSEACWRHGTVLGDGPALAQGRNRVFGSQPRRCVVATLP